MVEIKVKKKHVAGKGLYGYPRVHSGNNNKKVHKIGGLNRSDPYVREDHVLVLLPNMKKRMLHGENARHWQYADAVVQLTHPELAAKHKER